LLLSGSGREATVEILTARECSTREIERIADNKQLYSEKAVTLSQQFLYRYKKYNGKNESDLRA